MKLSALVMPLAAIAMLPAPAFAEAAQPQSAETSASQAYIPFANHGGVQNWQATGKSTIYFEDAHRKWFKAVLDRPCFDLPYTLFIGVDAGPGGRLDKWSGVYIAGEHYLFSSFQAIDGKPPKKEKAKDSA